MYTLNANPRSVQEGKVSLQSEILKIMFSPSVLAQKPLRYQQECHAVCLGMSHSPSWSFREHRIMSLSPIMMLPASHLPAQGPQKAPRVCRDWWGCSLQELEGALCLSDVSILAFPPQVFQCLFLLRLGSAHHGTLPGGRCLQQWVSLPFPFTAPHPTWTQLHSLPCKVLPSPPWHKFQVPKTLGDFVMTEMARAQSHPKSGPELWSWQHLLINWGVTSQSPLRKEQSVYTEGCHGNVHLCQETWGECILRANGACPLSTCGILGPFPTTKMTN